MKRSFVTLNGTFDVSFFCLNCVLSASLLLQIYYWGQSRSVNARRRRRAIPDDAPSVVALGGNTSEFVVTNLTPYSNYDIIVKAFNNGGEGPPSDEVSAETLEAGKRINRMLADSNWMFRRVLTVDKFSFRPHGITGKNMYNCSLPLRVLKFTL